MKQKLNYHSIALFWLAFIILHFPFSTAKAQGTAFTYQGRLNNGGIPTSGSYDLTFTLYTTNITGSAIAGPVTNNAVSVTNGLFMVLVDLGNAFTGTSNWLEIAVSTNGANAFTTLAPRQQITPTPYALFAGTASNVSGTIPAAQLPASPAFPGTVSATAFVGSGANVTNVNAAALNGLSASNFWQLAGNSVAAGQFLGSTNNQPVEIWVNGQHALRLEPSLQGEPNLIGNSSYNNISPSNDYSGIFEGYGNQIQSFSSGSIIGGGTQNLIQGNDTLYPGSDLGSVIAGGDNNTIQSNGYNATISGGLSNTIKTNAITATIGGGNNNLILANTGGGTIGGGLNNQVSGGGATVPGGNSNRAGGADSFAAGTDAYATNNGSFVLADYQFVTFTSTSNNQFSARFTGGVRFVTAGAGMTLDGQPILAGSNGTGLTNVNAGTLNGFGSTAFWKTNGNTGANPTNGAYLGTADNLPLELRVNNQRVLRLEPNPNSANVIGGCPANVASNGFFGQFIGGGGIASSPNRVGGYYAAVVGGAGNTASGGSSTAMGSGTTASGDTSTAMGDQTIGSGGDSTAMGYSTTASGGESTAMGSRTTASGDYSTAMGNQTTASGNSSTVMGNNSTASGQSSLAAGNLCVASGLDSIALGYNTKATNSNSTAMGSGTVASGSFSTAMGVNTTASGTSSTAMGVQTVANGAYSTALGYYAQAANTGSFVWMDTASITTPSSIADNSLTFRASGGYRLFSNAGATAGVSLAANGTAWATISDQNAKKNFTPVNGESVLDKLANVPVERWNYKWEKDSDVPNIGPMAQAFKAAFYPGRDDKSITTLEFDGVELAAIQGLNEKLEEQSKEKDAEIQVLGKKLDELQAMVKQLAAQK